MSSLSKLLAKFNTMRMLFLSTWPIVITSSDVCNQTNTHQNGAGLSGNCVIKIICLCLIQWKRVKSKDKEKIRYCTLKDESLNDFERCFLLNFVLEIMGKLRKCFNDFSYVIESISSK